MTLRVVVCRAARQAGPLLAALDAHGVETVELPLLEIVPPPDGGAAMRVAIGRLDEFDWVAFTSANAVAAVAAELGDPGWPPNVRRAVVGRATARALTDLGITVDVVASPATANDLAAQMPLEPGESVLAPLGVLATDDLVAGVRRRGASAHRVDAYATVAPMHTPEAIDAALDAHLVLLTAPSIVDRLVELADGRVIPPGICIGPRTLERADQFGLDVVAVAQPHDDDGLLSAVVAEAVRR